MSTSTINRINGTNGAKAIRADVPLLLNGDHLSLPEFERRYWAMANVKKAELVEGIVVMTPPISNSHGEAHGDIFHFLKLYADETPGVTTGLNSSIRLDGKNEYQPDALMRIESSKIGRSKIGADGLIDGGPELVVEVSMSSAGYDLHEKKSVYERNHVPEYIVWRLMDSAIDWFCLENGLYVPLKPQADGVVKSRVFPGFRLNLAALAARDEKKTARSLASGIGSKEHLAFIKRLKQA